MVLLAAISIGALLREVHTSANVRQYAEIVKTLSLARRLGRVGEEIAARGRGDFGELGAWVAEAEARIAEIGRARPDASSAWLAAVLQTVLANVEARYARRNEADAHITGVPTGFRQLDGWTSGLQKGALTIVAARPAHRCAAQMASSTTSPGGPMPRLASTSAMSVASLRLTVL